MNKVVLDASVILAVINSEPGQEQLTPELLSRSVCGAVNLAEVYGKLLSRGWPPDEAWEDATSPVQQVLPFDSQQARIAGDLTEPTRHLGLSLGDRACIALALSLRVPVFTAERNWKKLKLQVPIHVIR